VKIRGNRQSANSTLNASRTPLSDLRHCTVNSNIVTPPILHCLGSLLWSFTCLPLSSTAFHFDTARAQPPRGRSFPAHAHQTLTRLVQLHEPDIVHKRHSAEARACNLSSDRASPGHIFPYTTHSPGQQPFAVLCTTSPLRTTHPRLRRERYPPWLSPPSSRPTPIDCIRGSEPRPHRLAAMTLLQGRLSRRANVPSQTTTTTR
jgi:hypothetical protein